MARAYRLGRRQASVDRTSRLILDAARALVAESHATQVSVGAVARRAGVSRITVYNRFGSRADLLRAIRPGAPAAPAEPGDPRQAVRRYLVDASARWATNPALFRHLPGGDQTGEREGERLLAERLAAADALRPGCSLKEAEDVLAALSSFEVFDRLYKDGRRSPPAVAEILMRLVSGIMA